MVKNGTLLVASMAGLEADQEIIRQSGVSVIAAPQTLDLRAIAGASVLWAYPAGAARRGAVKPDGWPGSIRWVELVTTGLDTYASWLFESTPVTCGRGTLSEPIAEYVMAAIHARAKRWDEGRARSPNDWTGLRMDRIEGATIALLGFGSIGQAVARRALALGMQVVAWRRSPGQPVAGVRFDSDLASVLSVADHAVLALPSTPLTYRLMGREALSALNPGAHLINVARGDILDQEALVEAIDSGHLGYATLDVTEPEPLPENHPLYARDRIRITPHMAGRVETSNRRFAPHFAANLQRFLKGEPLADLVDYARGY
jgi:phosphoglycerate dehydrogenase-like enzyme